MDNILQRFLTISVYELNLFSFILGMVYTLWNIRWGNRHCAAHGALCLTLQAAPAHASILRDTGQQDFVCWRGNDPLRIV